MVESEIGNGITNDTTLTDAGKKHIGREYIGTFAQDTVPKKLPVTAYFIVNTGNQSGGGIHWLSVAKRGNILYINDSFGRKTGHLILRNFAKKMKARGYRIVDADYDVDQNDVKEQNCGARSIASLMVAKRLGIRKYLQI